MKHILALLGILSLWSGAATAAVGHVDVKPLTARDADIAPSRYAQGLLWKIEKPGVAPSYLFGTIHSDDPRVTALPPPVTAAFDACQRFTMEALIDGDGLVRMAQAMYFDDGRTLEQVIGRPLYAQTVKALAAHGVSAQSVENQKPWAVVMSLSMPPLKTGEFLDLILEERAGRQDKTVTGLETMDEQIAVFNGLPLADQVALLRETVASQADFNKEFEGLLNAYLARDLAALARLSMKHSPDENRMYRTVMDRLLTRRNTRMAERMQPLLNEGASFIAVGAAHLPGQTGLLNLIEKAGYRVTSVY
ncbi:MAG: TraB/GumN family protein [Sulfuricaulis sp.]